MLLNDVLHAADSGEAETAGASSAISQTLQVCLPPWIFRSIDLIVFPPSCRCLVSGLA